MKTFILALLLLLSSVARAEFPQEMECLAKNIYFEARGETYKGKVAVAQVTLNRVESGEFPTTVCGVVYQSVKRNKRKACQFSWACDKRSRIDTESDTWEEANDIAFKILRGEVSSGIIKHTKALYFHNGNVAPSWAGVKRRVAVIGKHSFYKNNKKGT